MDHHLVKFIDDGILYVCENKRLSKGIGNTNRMVRYKHYGLFKADILHSGGKQAMIEKMKLLQNNITKSNCENIPGRSEKQLCIKESIPQCNEDNNRINAKPISSNVKDMYLLRQNGDIAKDEVSIPRITKSVPEDFKKQFYVKQSMQECKDNCVIEDLSPANIVNELRENEIAGLYFIPQQEELSQVNISADNHRERDVVNKCKRSLNFTPKESSENVPIADNVEVPNVSVENMEVGPEIITIKDPNLLVDNSIVGKDIIILSESLNKCKPLQFEARNISENEYMSKSIVTDVEVLNISVENTEVGTEMTTVENLDFFPENSTVEKDVIALSQNIPSCIGIININTETGLIELNIQNILHARRYKDHVFLNEDNSLQGIITETQSLDTSIHAC